MQLIGPTTLLAGSYVPFTDIKMNWATAGPSRLILYNSATMQFTIPFASSNDYYIRWYISLKTANIPDLPIIGLEFLYNNNLRCDYIVSPIKTTEVGSTSIYHVTDQAPSDMLSLGIKIVGDANPSSTFVLESASNVTASIMILGL